MGTDVKPATREDALELAAHMPKADAEECRAHLGITPEEAVLGSMAVSDESFALRRGGELLAIYGVGPQQDTPPGTLGNVWLMTTEAVERHRKDFLKAARPAVRVLLGHYPVLVGFVDTEHAETVRFARWLGFEVKEPRPGKAPGRLVHLLVLRRRQWRF